MSNILLTEWWANEAFSEDEIREMEIKYTKYKGIPRRYNAKTEGMYTPIPEFRMYKYFSDLEIFCNEIALPWSITKKEFDNYMNSVPMPKAYKKDDEYYLVAYNGKVAQMHPVGRMWYSTDSLTFDPTGAEELDFDELMKYSNELHKKMIEEGREQLKHGEIREDEDK